MTLSGGREQSFHDKMVLPKDRKNVYTQTLAAASPGADSYEQLITVCRKLHLPETDCYEVFRRMVFNVLANNTDDHNKIFHLS